MSESVVVRSRLVAPGQVDTATAGHVGSDLPAAQPPASGIAGSVAAVARRTAGGAAWVFAAYVAYRALGFLTNLVLARLLSPAEFGLVSFAMIMIGASALLQDVGVPAALIYSRRDIHTIAGTALTINVVVATLLVAVVVLASPVLASLGGDALIGPIVMVLAAGLIVTSLGSVQNAMLVKQMSFRRKFLPDVVPSLASGVLSIFLALFGFGVWSLVSGHIARTASSTLLLWRLSPVRPRPTFDRSVAAELLKYGRHISFASVLGFAVANVDYFIVGYMLGTTELGLYTMAYILATMPAYTIGQVVSTVAFPAFSQLRNDPEELFRFFSKVFGAVCAVAMPVGVIIYIGAPAYANVILGSKWAGIVAPLQILSFFGVMLSLDYCSGAAYKASGRPDWMWRWTLVKLAILVPLMVFMARFGIAGIAAAHAMVVLVMFPLGVPVFARMMKIRSSQFWRLLVPPSVATAAMCAVVAVGLRFPEVAEARMGLAGAAAMTLAALAVYIAALAWLQPHLVRQGWFYVVSPLPRIRLSLSKVAKLVPAVRLRDWHVYLALLVLTVLFRSSTFFTAAADWDESVYLLVSRSLLEGHLPYTEVWDHKPPGIYVIFAGAQAVFGHSMLAIRLLSCLVVALTCVVLYKFGRSMTGGSQAAGVAAAGLYGASSLLNGGLAANTEIFFAPLVALAFYGLLGAPHLRLTSGRLLLVGLLIGLALQIKYVVAFELLAIAGLVTWAYVSQRRPMRNLTVAGLTMGAGVLSPAIATALVFTIGGRFTEYFQANFEANLRYTAEVAFSATELSRAFAAQVAGNPILWASALLAPLCLFLPSRRRIIRTETMVLLAVWLIAGLLGACLTRRYYPHYFLQVLAPLSLLSAVAFSSALQWQKAVLPRLAFIGLLIIPLWVQTVQPLLVRSASSVYRWHASGVAELRDRPAAIARYLQGRISAADGVYVVDEAPVIYYLLGVPAPTRYVLPHWLANPGFAKMAGVQPIAELETIMAQQPLYVVAKDADARSRDPFLSNTEFYDSLADHLTGRYRLEHSIGGVDLYRRVSSE
jgi:O-antigen/teichoic acid export membrane protein/4-amino-4-deoxy-L-arabinose transferase-like glycosyltransferase